MKIHSLFDCELNSLVDIVFFIVFGAFIGYIESMETTNYSEDIQELINQCPLEVSSLSPNATKTIKKLLKIADEFNDNSLKSYVYYHESLYYYFKADIAAYRPLIKKAINCALLADDQIMLSRIYNFIAVDAHNSGCFDIAYNYYSLAYNYAEKNNIGDSQAIIESNLGRIYAELKIALTDINSKD